MLDNKNNAKIVLELLASHLGVEPDDVSEDDSLTTDLHMRVTDISDFLGSLEEKGIDVDEIDLAEIETVGELIEALGENL
ncbi:hypothetical protein A2715_01615 [Candidatus Woesebacteria bacterium RIFCSPHIGHO2_01_FULL_39_32]|nr:MAG: hypothetical protein UT61_C0003G0025 [Candidatus Woesebacteria bacterium GW2011_GWA1_39_8]OGM23856.1 MAG: hypothetical protein A2715_01615 [Candidatus Woesebacteria bacterium RIFCSPHIGHO2_01_FULL_39_32]